MGVRFLLRPQVALGEQVEEPFVVADPAVLACVDEFTEGEVLQFGEPVGVEHVPSAQGNKIITDCT